MCKVEFVVVAGGGAAKGTGCVRTQDPPDHPLAILISLGSKAPKSPLCDRHSGGPRGNGRSFLVPHGHLRFQPLLQGTFPGELRGTCEQPPWPCSFLQRTFSKTTPATLLQACTAQKCRKLMLPRQPAAPGGWWLTDSAPPPPLPLSHH